ncbi:hypothetical protein F8388_003314 [Cannabis sativa]|uniref:Autophagy protein 5 n=1 Tax=Cannabis sativa TaxID=3483 RepID=A0A7J6E5I3_CANSA|nr:hypothetical protein G4B88_020119 [Cannabis sativa]KAF4357167.1 hypothetical protein F8388_003314 [Cannabis sativa]
MTNWEARKFVWQGAIPLQIHLHESEVTTVPSPPPALILAPRLGYLPLYVPTGVLFDLLCAEPERPWNLTVHFRGYPGTILLPCEGEDSIKWNFINSLKEAAYIINGNCKNVMNMSQADQVELWRSVLNGNLEVFVRVSSKLKLGIVSDEYTVTSNSLGSGLCVDETDHAGRDKAGRVPIRLYVWSVSEDVNDLEDAPPIDTWDNIAYINQPVNCQEGKCLTLHDAVKSLLPEYFPENSLADEESSKQKGEEEEETQTSVEDDASMAKDVGEVLCKPTKSCNISDDNVEIKLIRIQGIEPKPEIPFSWVANSLMNPDYFLHICVCLKVPRLKIQ